MNYLKDYRTISLRRMAKKINMSPSYLSEIENGIKYPSFEFLGKLAEAYDLSLDKMYNLLLENKQ